MSAEPSPLNDREERLDAAVVAYLQEKAAGRPPERRLWLSRHPDLADDLAEFIADQESLDRLAAPLRAAVTGRPAEPTPLAEGVRLGDFRIIREVGRGGMGVVYEAEQVSLQRRVALKVLPFASTLDPKRLLRFQNEARAAGQLHHTSIVPVFAVGCERGLHYYAMQYIDGQTLAAVIHELKAADRPKAEGRRTKDESSPEPAAPADADHVPTGPYPPASPHPSSLIPHPSTVAGLSTDRSGRGKEYYRAVARLGQQAAEALEYAHQVGVVHRDVKPANLMVDARANLWVTDFGLAQFQSDVTLTQTGDLVGTLRYMSPEQALAKRVAIDHRTDVYSLGATLYELLTLRPVFGGADRQELLRQIAFEEPVRPRRVEKSIPAELETVALKALEKNPADRYATAQELADDLRRFLEHQPIRAKRPTLAQRLGKWARRHQGLVRMAVGVLLLATVGSGVATAIVLRERADAVRQRQAAEQERDRARRAHYAASVHVIHGAWEAADMDEARARLDGLVPPSEDPDLRGWEWHYLDALCRRARLTLNRLPVADHPNPVSDGPPDVPSPTICYDAVWSPDGRWLATGGGPGDRRQRRFSGPGVLGTVELSDAATGRPVRSWTAHEQGRVTCLAWSPEGKRLASASADGTVRVWDTATGRAGVVLAGHRREVLGVAWSPDGGRLVSAGRDGTVRLWDASTGKQIRSFRGHQYLAFSAAWSPTGRWVASVGMDGAVRIWDTETGQALQELAAPAIEKNYSGARMVCWSPNGRHLAAASRETIRVWEAATGRLVQILAGHQKAVLAVAWSPEGLRLASAAGDRTTRVWDVTKGEELLCLRGHSSMVCSVAWHPDGERLATASWDGTAKVWDAIHPQETLPVGPGRGTRHVAWDAGGSRLLVAGFEGVGVWDADSGRQVGTLGQGPAVGAVWSPDGKRAAACPNGPMGVWEVATGRRLVEIPREGEWWGGLGAWSPDGSRLAWPDRRTEARDPNAPRARTVVWEGVRIWDTATWSELAALTIRIPNGSAAAGAVAWRPDGRRVAVVSMDGTLWMYDPGSGDVVFSAPKSGPDTSPALAWRPDGGLLAVGDTAGTVGLVDPETGRDLHRFGAHSSGVRALAWSPDGQRLASAAWVELGEVKVWDPATWQAVLAWRREPEGGPTALAWSPDGRRLASAGPLQPVKIWDAAARAGAWGDAAMRQNDWAWSLATGADPRWRDPAQAVRLARQAVATAPQVGPYWNTLGASYYRAGDWQGAVGALTRSMQLRQGGDAFDWFLLGMAHWHLGDREQARRWYNRAVEWTRKRNPHEELKRFEAEAAELMGARAPNANTGTAKKSPTK